MSDLDTLGKRLKWVLNTRGISMRAFHQAAGLPYRSVQEYCADGQQPGAEALVKIRRTLGLNIDWLLSGEGQPFLEAEGRQAPTVGEVIAELKKWHDAAAQLGNALELLKPQIAALEDAANRGMLGEVTPELLRDVVLKEIPGLQEKHEKPRAKKSRT